MRKFGFLVISDSLLSFPRDSVPFEERVIDNIGEDKIVLSRKISGKNAAHCLDLIRANSSNLADFASSVANPKAYIMLGFSENRYATNNSWPFWFDRCLKSITNELDALGFMVCFCLPSIEAKEMPQEHRKWLKNAFNSVAAWVMAYGAETLHISLKCQRDWRYPTYASIANCAKSLSKDFIESCLGNKMCIMDNDKTDYSTRKFFIRV